MTIKAADIAFGACGIPISNRDDAYKQQGPEERKSKTLGLRYAWHISVMTITAPGEKILEQIGGKDIDKKILEKLASLACYVACSRSLRKIWCAVNSCTISSQNSRRR